MATGKFQIVVNDKLKSKSKRTPNIIKGKKLFQRFDVVRDNIVPVKFNDDELRQLDDACKQLEMNRSEVIRYAIVLMLTPSEP